MISRTYAAKVAAHMLALLKSSDWSPNVGESLGLGYFPEIIHTKGYIISAKIKDSRDGGTVVSYRARSPEPLMVSAEGATPRQALDLLEIKLRDGARRLQDLLAGGVP